MRRWPRTRTVRHRSLGAQRVVCYRASHGSALANLEASLFPRTEPVYHAIVKARSSLARRPFGRWHAGLRTPLAARTANHHTGHADLGRFPWD